MANVTPSMFCHCGKAQHHSYVECNLHVKFKYLTTTSSFTSTDRPRFNPVNFIKEKVLSSKYP